jgi:hypothetical protein
VARDRYAIEFHAQAERLVVNPALLLVVDEIVEFELELEK